MNVQSESTLAGYNAAYISEADSHQNLRRQQSFSTLLLQTQWLVNTG